MRRPWEGSDRLLLERVPASPSEKRMLQSLMCLTFSTVMDQWFGCLRLPHFQMGVPCSLGWFNASGDGDNILPHGRMDTCGINPYTAPDCNKRYQTPHSTHG